MVTDEKCPEAYDGGTHHLVPRREGRIVGGKESLYVQTCLFCGVTYRFGEYWTPDTTQAELEPYRGRQIGSGRRRLFAR